MASWLDEIASADPLWADALRERDAALADAFAALTTGEGSLYDFIYTNGLWHLGLQRSEEGTWPIGWWYREWAPAALACSLVGDFNGWNPSAHRCTQRGDGVFEVFVPDGSTKERLAPGSRYKAALRLRTVHGGEELVHRLPAWARCTRQDPQTGELSP